MPDPSLFEARVEDLLEELSAKAPPENVQKSLRAAYLLHPEPWHGRALRDAAAGRSLSVPSEISRVDAPDGTTKLLVSLADGRAVECVLIPGVRGTESRLAMSARNREDGTGRKRRPTAAACVSSQVGCAAGCSFCASGLGGLTRNLDAGEITLQALLLRREAAARGLRLSTVVFMGMGEPLHNAANVARAVRNLTHRHAGALPPSGITVSTVGILPGMDVLAGSKSPPHLAISLHAPDDATRASIVRTAPKLWPVAETIDAAQAYRERTGRHVTVSYVLLDGVNDSQEMAVELARVLRGRAFHVNLIPHNAVDGLPFRATPPERASRFWKILREHGVVVHIRKQRGADGEAACGQLRRRTAESPPP
ncbi:MAG: 23S rRNA (adenine(2503)-C(2))-methyltransferase RlmN [Candidatus Brocadiae bacterium]|nr:23S rRNA (adenine(2503)-C(2))-methyltransferase RlmN [Candidatus Brocadiia bacterium]